MSLEPADPAFPASLARALRAYPLIVVAWLLLGTTGLRAEATWLRAERYTATPGAVLRLTPVTADEFGPSATEIAPERILAREGQLANLPLDMPAVGAAGSSSANFSVTLTRPGVALVELNLKPEARSISRSGIERYLRQMHVNDDIQTAWEQIEEPNPWQEVRTLRLKAFVRVGQPAPGDRTASASRSVGLDLVPDQDPTSLRENGHFRVHVLRDGRPVAGAIVEYLSTGESRQHVVLTDDEGQAEAVMDASGEWLVQCAMVKRVHAGNHDWEVAVTTLTVAIR